MSMSQQKKEVWPPVGGETLEDAQKETGALFLRVHQMATLSRNLEGKLLTICDAVIVDKTQSKAVKDLVREAMRGFRFHAEAVAGGEADEYSVGVPTLDIEDTEQGLKIPTMMEQA